jgi:hypothetical protein
VNAAWFIRSRQMATEFRFWLAITGYNPRDRSLSQRIYLVYAAVFFSIWGFAVLSMLAAAAAGLLTGITPSAPVTAAAGLSTLALAVWGLYRLFLATRRSPIAFSEDDRYLICQTPADRRAIAIAWFPGAWIASALPFWAIAVVFGFAQVELALSGKATIADAPRYIAAGLRALAVVLPLQAGLLAGVWAAGAHRLQPGNARSPVRLLAPALAIVVLALWLGTSLPGMAQLAQAVWRGVNFPLLSAYAGQSWLPGVLVSLVTATAGLWLLRAAAAEMNLNQAARESSGEEALTAVALLGNPDQAAQARDERRLGAPRTSPLLNSPRIPALDWKQGLRTLRLFHLRDIAPWLILLSAVLGGVLISGWGPQLWGLVVWTLVAGQQAAAPLRRDLQRWWLLRQLPISNQGLIVSEVLPPAALALTTTWLALLAAFSLTPQVRLALALAAPGAVAVTAVAAALDVLRQSKSVRLIAGIIPDSTALGVILGLFGPGLALFVIYSLPDLGWFAGVVSLALSWLLANFYLKMAASALRKVD